MTLQIGDRRGRKRKRNTVAGDKIHLKEREGGIGTELRRFKNSSGDDAEVVDLDINNTTNEMDLNDELDEDEGQDDALALMRRGEEVGKDEQTTVPVSPQRASERLLQMRLRPSAKVARIALVNARDVFVVFVSQDPAKVLS
ncbi:uncharacterized protein PV07_08747 [Cladophialophora immunda]|uniref:Uncharacterized protein n=1 Tax=Cladophialophora immunda TaxID=569365 RepID=A0A0D1ZCW6_9EURO|nr:uncharacterized protein PV07_08747 [Cladophialophora immunda]KIW25581.1 hypothetical protein PV07_08747 [Cladophialophora immunda]